jgi:hypothetical protein
VGKGTCVEEITTYTDCKGREGGKKTKEWVRGDEGEEGTGDEGEEGRGEIGERGASVTLYIIHSMAAWHSIPFLAQRVPAKVDFFIPDRWTLRRPEQKKIEEMLTRIM